MLCGISLNSSAPYSRLLNRRTGPDEARRNRKVREHDRRRRGGEAWLTFFLAGVQQTAEGAVTTAQRLSEIVRLDRAQIESAGRRAGSALRVHEALKARPILSMSDLCKSTGLSFPAVSSAMERLAGKKITRELTGKRRNRLFVYDRYLAILNEGTQRA
jgi:Fic family protein